MIIAIDTSCYTTSLAAIDQEGTVVLDRRLLLRVKPGEKGLRQSEAIFQHLHNLPLLLNEQDLGTRLTAVAASIAPRPVAGSYLPVFKVAASFGELLARTAGVPFLATTHQEGHIRAGLDPSQTKDGAPWLAWHISGGTTELLRVTPKTQGYAIQKIGGTSDLQVGQFIDRVGVALGMPFPAGPYLEKLALSEETDDVLPVVTSGLTLSFSGPESAAQRKIAAGTAGTKLARQVFDCIAKSLFQVSLNAARSFGIQRILMVGGVAANSLIRAQLNHQGAQNGLTFCFAPVQYAGDNAVGVAFLGYDGWKRGILK